MKIRDLNFYRTIIFVLSFVLLSGCQKKDEASGEQENGNANGSGSSTVASGETSVLLTPSANSAWKDFTVDLGSDFLDTNICSGKSIFGRSGAAVCGGSVWTVSTLGIDSSNVGTISGSVYTYNAAANIAYNVINIDMGADYLAGNICSSKSILTLAGTAVCNSVIGDLTASNMHRTVGTAQMTLTTERTTSSYAAGYRDVPDVTKDDDGYDASSAVVKASRPATICGTTQTSINDRIAHCLAQNGAGATWTGATKGISGEGTWKLVTRTATAKEVWRDERTGFLWGDRFSSASWCRASGNAQTAAQDGTGSGICDPADPFGYGAQDSTPSSICSESGSLVPAIGGENWVTGVYDPIKGSMGAIATGSSPSVRWRLPTMNDWKTADVNGIRFVLPRMDQNFWSSTIVSNNRIKSYLFDGFYGSIMSDNYTYNYYYVRCIGR